MDKHITLLATLHIAYGVLGALVALLVFFILIGGGQISGDPDAIAVTSIVGTFVACFLLLVVTPGIIGGIYLLKRQQWARILLLVVGALNLINMPIGTILGVYTIWVLVRPDVVQEFSQPATVSPPPPAPPSTPPPAPPSTPPSTPV